MPSNRRKELWPLERTDDGPDLAPDLLHLALRFLDPLDLTSGSAIENIDRVHAKVAEAIASTEDIFTNTSVADLGQLKAWVPDRYSQIFRSYVFDPSGFWTIAQLHCKV